MRNSIAKMALVMLVVILRIILLYVPVSRRYVGQQNISYDTILQHYITLEVIVQIVQMMTEYN